MLKRTCDNCVLPSTKGGVCPIFNANMAGQDGCPRHTAADNVCAVCGSYILGQGILIPKDNEFKMVCGRCATVHDCRLCSHKGCAFDTDESCFEPKVVTVRRQEGNMTIQQQVMNPKRMELTCAAGCACYNQLPDEKIGVCMRMQDRGENCPNFKLDWRG